MSKEEFESKWLYKPVKLQGLFDHDKEMQINRTVKGDTGLEILTPLYTGVDKAGKLQGLMVNRGRIPFEYRDSKMHHTPAGEK